MIDFAELESRISLAMLADRYRLRRRLGTIRKLHEAGKPIDRELKLVITSATIDSVRFSRHFRTSRGPAPVVEVSGRNYPVEVCYRPFEPDEEDDGGEPDLERAVLDAVDELTSIDPTGDVLIFMPTERHIHDTAKALRGRLLSGARAGRPVEILPLYARLTAKEQQRVFEPHRRRRIVIATNVAESSLTVPGDSPRPGAGPIPLDARGVPRLALRPGSGHVDPRLGQVARPAMGEDGGLVGCVKRTTSPSCHEMVRFTHPTITWHVHPAGSNCGTGSCSPSLSDDCWATMPGTVIASDA